MKFTLLFYTDGWESGPTVELSHIPAPGSIVWTGGRRRDEEDSMYYVDNVMYPERGMDREDTVYLYVRPYTGYTRYAPMTEADRTARPDAYRQRPSEPLLSCHAGREPIPP